MYRYGQTYEKIHGNRDGSVPPRWVSGAQLLGCRELNATRCYLDGDGLASCNGKCNGYVTDCNGPYDLLMRSLAFFPILTRKLIHKSKVVLEHA